MIKLNGKQITITKLQDTAFNGQHPNGINENYTRTGIAYCDLEINSSLCIDGYFYTSTVVSIDIENLTFNTLNSQYKLKINE